MEIAGFIIPLAILIVIAALIAIIAFLSGKKRGGYWERMEKIEAEKNYTKKSGRNMVTIYESFQFSK